MDKTIDIVLVTYNRIAFTRKCYKSILENTKFPYRLIVVDNCSTDGTREFLVLEKARGNISELILNNKNKGLEKALNSGFRRVKSPIFVTIDNDIIVSEYWLVKLKALLNQNKKFGAVACRPQVLIGVGNIFKDAPELVETNVVGGSARLFLTEAVKEAKGWTDVIKNKGRGMEEWDICGRLKEKRYKVGFARDIWCYHQFGEEGNWGYDNLKEYRMGRMMEHSPQDADYNKLTMEPTIKHNE